MFTHLHVHTEYSLLDGAARISDLMDACEKAGMDSIAITDHGAMFGVVDFYRAAKARGIHPVIGCEVYMAPRSRLQTEQRDRESYHLILLCENETGYKNLIWLVTQAYLDGFYYRPRIDWELLEGHTEGLIAMSACLSGQIPRLIRSGRYEEAKKTALRFSELFGPDHFYLELQDHGIPEERRVNLELVSLHEETGIPMTVTNDVHYVRKEDAEAQDILLCIQTGKTVDDPDRMKMEGDQFYFKTEEEMAAVFPWAREAMDNTHEIAMRCHFDFDFSTTYLPDFPTPGNEPHASYLRRLCEEGLPKRYETVTDELRARLDYELGVIESMGYVDYYLIVWDFIRYAREQGIEVGPGRGSGAGSLAAYCLDITQVDPIRYDLIFERFLNPERVSMPDFDVDFCYVRRSEVIDYVNRKYGSDHVAQIVTFGTLKARGVIRDVGRVLNLPYAEVDAVAKMIPMDKDVTIAGALESNRDLRDKAASDPGIARLLDLAKRLEGLPRHTSTHAAGVVISKNPIVQHVPLNRNGDVMTTQFPMTTIEELGLLKMDFLGLRTLTVIRDCLDMLAKKGIEIDLARLPMDDPEVYETISRGETDGMFQLESAGMRAFMRELKPDRFEDLVAGISLYRPGPMDYIPKYIASKKHPESVVYEHPLMKNALEVTYGCMVYQEQVMQLVRDMAGYSLGRSDLVRRAMAKKKHDVMRQEREYFVHGIVGEDGTVEIPGAVRMGVNEETANAVFDAMMDFANYAFNKSHAAAYAVVTYRTAWLKTHYPVEFMAANMNSYLENKVKVADAIQSCRQHGIAVEAPNVNHSGVGFTAEDGKIWFGLSAIRNVGTSAAGEIVRAREKGGLFRDLNDFLRRCGAEVQNKRLVESLIMAGAFDSLGRPRSQLLSVCEQVIERAHRENRGRSEGQVSLFDIGAGRDAEPEIPYPDLPEFPGSRLLAMEKEMMGVYASGHPLLAVENLQERFPVDSSWFVSESENDDEETDDTEPQGPRVEDGQIVRLAGIVTGLSVKMTKKNDSMAFLTLEDLRGQVEVLLFPAVYRNVKAVLEPDSLVCVEGRVTAREGESAKLIAQTVTRLDESEEKERPKGIAVRIPKGISAFQREAMFGALALHPGQAEVLVLDEETGKKYRIRSHHVRIEQSLLEDLNRILEGDCVQTL